MYIYILETHFSLYMPYVTTISLTEDDRRYIKDHNIPLSQFVRDNIKKLKETRSPEQVPTPKEEVNV